MYLGLYIRDVLAQFAGLGSREILELRLSSGSLCAGVTWFGVGGLWCGGYCSRFGVLRTWSRMSRQGATVFAYSAFSLVYFLHIACV